MAVEIRLCAIHDLEILRRIARETYDQAFRSMNTAETMQKYLETAFSAEKMLEELSNPKSSFFLMHTANKISGYLKLNEAPAQSDLNDPDSMELERIYVRNEFQGKGLGKILMSYSIQVARERAKNYIWLGVWERNVNAIALYERMGFKATGRHAFRMGDEIQRDLIMTLALDE